MPHGRCSITNAPPTATLTALLRGTDLGIDARASLRDAQIAAIAAWRTSNSTEPVTRIARAEAKRLALAEYSRCWGPSVVCLGAGGQSAQ